MDNHHDNRNVKVSVLILTYNQQDSIARCLDSVLSQKVDFSIEMIIGDDASMDDTEIICRAYATKYPNIIRYVRNNKNKGLRDNYYDCLLMANGKYIADIAGDDFWIDKSKLQKQTDFLDNNPDYCLVFTDWVNFDEEYKNFYSPWLMNKYPYEDLFYQDDLNLKLLSYLTPFPVHLSSALYRKDSFLKLYNKDSTPFRNKEFIPEDLQLVVLLSTIGKIKYLDFKSLAYSINSKSLTGTKSYIKLYDFHFSTLKLTKYLADKLGIDQAKLNKVYTNQIHYIVMQAFHARDGERLRQIKKLIKNWGLISKLRIKTLFILCIATNRTIWSISKKTLDIIRK